MLLDSNLIWIDLEMTGLNPEYNRILEIATIVTDSNLNILAEGPVLAVHQSDDQLLMMDKWNKLIHNRTGLLKRVKQSKYDENIAEILTLDFLKKWVPINKSPICGSSIHLDRRFLLKYMSKLESYFHYHFIDVSTLKELVYRWKPEILTKFQNNSTHQASKDIQTSIAELIYYRKYFICL